MLTRTLVAGIIDVRVGWRSNDVAKHAKDLAVRADPANRGTQGPFPWVLREIRLYRKMIATYGEGVNPARRKVSRIV